MKTRERGSLNIFRSRFIVITLVAVLCLTVIIGVSVKNYADDIFRDMAEPQR